LQLLSPEVYINSLFKFSFLSFFLICLTNFFNCSDKQIIDEDTFVKVYTDLVIAQDTLKENFPEPDKIKKEIFLRYNITEADYKTTVEYYDEDPERWDAFFNKVISYVEKRSKKP
jgi:hypothetical protein